MKFDSAVRNKRYKIKSGETVHLVVDSITGGNITFAVTDCSISGLGCIYDGTTEGEQVPWLNNDAIFPSSKLKLQGTEIGLGRLALRRYFNAEGKMHIAFSPIDTKIPVDGALGKYLVIDLDKDHGGQDLELSANKFNLSHFADTDFSDVDIFSRIRKFQVFFHEWSRSDKYAYANVRQKSKGTRIELGRVRKNGRRDYITMGSNDYLGLSTHPEVLNSIKNTLDIYGFGSTGSPVTTGLTDLHQELCSKIAYLHQKEDAILFNSGYAANIGIVNGLCGARDLVIADQLVHASLQDALAMSKATQRYFMHNNVEHLEKILKNERKDFAGALVITEGVFSMDGDTPPLDKIFQICRKYNARIMVDQAHCFGVLGETGLGICQKFNLLKEVDIIMGTFSKITGGIGGFVTGSKDLMDWYRHFARSYVFTVSLPPSTVAGVSKALEIFRKEPERVHQLHANIKHFCKGLSDLGYHFSQPHESAVVPVVIGDERKLGQIYQSLLDDGIMVIPIVYPAVALKNCRFRFTIMATHTQSDLDYVLSSLEKAMIKADFKFETEPESRKIKRTA
jgi:8-amino-7-oxononanoate synthase